MISTAGGLFLTQHKYIGDIFESTGMAGAKEVYRPNSVLNHLLLGDCSLQTIYSNINFQNLSRLNMGIILSITNKDSHWGIEYFEFECYRILYF